MYTPKTQSRTPSNLSHWNLLQIPLRWTQHDNHLNPHEHVHRQLILHLHVETKYHPHNIVGTFKVLNILATKGMQLTCATIIALQNTNTVNMQVPMMKRGNFHGCIEWNDGIWKHIFFIYPFPSCNVVWYLLTAMVVSQQPLGVSRRKTYEHVAGRKGKQNMSHLENFGVSMYWKHKRHKKEPSGS